LIDILAPHESDLVLDPFCGSGVAPIEAWFRNRVAIGVDNNCFAIEIAKSKVDLIRAATAETAEKLLCDYDCFRRSRCDHAWRQETILSDVGIHPDAARWFITPVLSDIAIITAWLAERSTLTRPWTRVLQITLSSLLHKHFSRVRNYHYTYVVDRSKVKNDSPAPVDVPEIFKDRVRENFLGAQVLREELTRRGFSLKDAPAPTFRANRPQEANQVAPEPVDLVVTSPPYFGMNDYVRSQYLSWLILQWPTFDNEIVTESGSRRHRTSAAKFNDYLDDMLGAFDAVHKQLRPGGYLPILVGRFKTSLAVENDPVLKLSRMLDQLGFERIWRTLRRVQFRKINNVPYREEDIWVLRRA